MSARGYASVLSTLQAAFLCGVACSSPLDPLFDAEVLVTVQLPADAERVSLRVWNEEHQLVHDAWREVETAEMVLRLYPSTAPAHFRYARVEVEAWNAESCPVARAAGTYRYIQGQRRERLALQSIPELSQCEVRWVDPQSNGVSCSQQSPCNDLRDALARPPNTAERVVVLVAGDQGSYVGGYALDRAFDGPAPNRPNVIRSWPGRGSPRFEGTRGEDSVFNFCCGDEGPPHDGAQNVELDGLEIVGGPSFGVQLNGETTRFVTIRNTTLEDNGADANNPEIPGAGVVIAVGAHEVVLEHNLIVATRPAGGTDNFGVRVQHQGPPARVLRLLDSRIVADVSDAVRLSNVEGAVELNNNIICASSVAPLSQEPTSFVENLSVEGNVFLVGSEPIFLRGEFEKALVRNTFISDGQAPAIRIDATVSVEPTLSENLFVGTDGPAFEGVIQGERNHFWNSALPTSPGAIPVVDEEPGLRLDTAACLYGGRSRQSTAGVCAEWPSC